MTVADNLIRVISYNVLSDALCDAEHYCYSPPQATSNERRFELLKRLLRRHMAQGAVVCLQEVSRTWGARLLLLWEEEGYAYADALSGPQFNNYMGQVLAWPRARYELRDIRVVRVADTVRWPSAKEAAASQPKSPRSPSPRRRRVPDVWQEVRQRHNCFVAAALRRRSDLAEFVAATYHMPCLFGSDENCQVMAAHAALLASAVGAFAAQRGLPWMLCGDFNIKPGDPVYDLLQTGHLPEGHPQSPPLPAPFDGDWRCSAPPLRSAYAEVHGAAGAVTNVSKTKGAKPEQPAFKAVLDYVWLSPEWTVTEVVPIPTLRDVAHVESFPTLEQPSDHVLIGATLELPASFVARSRL